MSRNRSHLIKLRVLAIVMVALALTVAKPSHQANAAGSQPSCAIALTFCSHPLLSVTNYCDNRWAECSSEQGETQKEQLRSAARVRAERWSEIHPYHPADYNLGCSIP